eukprot:1997774-Rhodomonas_salina.5
MRHRRRDNARRWEVCVAVRQGHRGGNTAVMLLERMLCCGPALLQARAALLRARVLHEVMREDRFERHAGCRVLDQQSADQIFGRRRHVRGDLVLDLADALQGRLYRARLKGRTPDQQRVQQAAESPDVRGQPVGRAADHFGGHVVGSPADCPALSAFLCQRDRKPEV